MTSEQDKVPEWAMKAAKEVNRIYLHGGFPGLTDNLLARIIASHAPAIDEVIEKVPEWAMKAEAAIWRQFDQSERLEHGEFARIIAAHAPLDEAVKDGPWCDVCGGAIEFLCVNCDKKALERAQNG